MLSRLFLCVFLCVFLSRVATHGVGYPPRSCRCLPTNDCWPNDEAWATLNASVHGRLLRVKPPASPCHDPHYNPQACHIARERWHDSFWRSDQPGAMQNTNWEMYGNQSCLIGTNASIPCLQGAVPVYAIETREFSDVQRGIEFCTKYNLRLVIKNTGHDYLGRSGAYGSLSIWMHRLNNLTFHDKFTSDGCHGRNVSYRGSAMTAGVGAQWLQIYEAADAHKVVVVGAAAASVSNGGGYAQGGGHSILSHTFGLAADNILQFVLVTANGQLHTANECQNTDLFWALRGGGGGTFGVVLSATHKTHPPLTNLLVASLNISTTNVQTFQKSLETFFALHPALSDAGWSGYFYIGSESGLLGTYVHPKATNISSARNAFAPLFRDDEPDNQQKHISLKEFRFSSFLTMYKSVFCSGGATCSSVTGSAVLLASRLIPRENFERYPAELARGAIELLKRGVRLIIGHLVAGGAVAQRPKQFDAVNPAWRGALVHVVNVADVPEGASQDEIWQIGQNLSDANGVLREMTPGSGSYMNEADYWEPEWQQSFFGDQYSALLGVKKMVDPEGLFVCRHCVGSDSWSDKLNCYV